MLDRLFRIEVGPTDEAIERNKARIDQLSTIVKQAAELSVHLPQRVQTPIVDGLLNVWDRATEERLDRINKPIRLRRKLVIGNSIRFPLPAKKHR